MVTDLIAPHDLRSAALVARMPPSCLRVYLTLLGHRSEREMYPGCAWPAVATIGAESGLSERAVQDALRALKRHGWLEQVASPFRVAVYQLRVGEAVPKLIAERQPRGAYLEQLRTARCEPSHPDGDVSEGASRRTEGCEASHPWVRAVAPGGCEPSHPILPVELSIEIHPPIVPPPGDTGAPTPEPIAQPLSQPELLTPPIPAPTPATPEPKRRPSKPKPLPPEQDPTWSAFAALAVEAGHVTQPPRAEAKTYRKGRNRGQVLAELAAEHGADEVLAVWRHTLTSDRESPQWWRGRLQGPALIDAFLAGTAYAKLANDLEAARDIERKAQRPRLALVPKAVEATDPVGAFRAVCAALGDDMATAAKIAAMVPDAGLRFDVLALAASLAATVPLGFSFGRTWSDEALAQRLPEARVRWQAHLDARQAERAPLQVAQ